MLLLRSHSEYDAGLGDHGEAKAFVEPSGRIVREDSKHDLLPCWPPGREQLAEYFRPNAGSLIRRQNEKLLQPCA